MGRVQDKVALITGAARGQGRSHAIRLAEEGADIVLVDACAPMPEIGYDFPDLAELEETAAAVEALDRRALVCKADIRDQAALDAVVEQARAELGGIDILCANAAVGSHGRSWELTENQWQTMLDIDLTGTWRTTKAVVPSMIEAGRGGSIVLISSFAGSRGLLNAGHYVAAKHGVIGLMRTMANELGAYGIRVNAVQPGTVWTPMADNSATLRLFSPGVENPTKDDAAKVLATMNPLRVGWLDPVDISNAVLWLASDEARYVTGIAVPVDGGWMNM